MEKFDPLEPFKNKEFFNEVFNEFKNFKFKLFGVINSKPVGKPSSTEFDLDLGKIHFTEKDFRGMSEIVERINKKWGTQITYCIFTSDKTGRDVLINIRSPKAPADLD